MPALAIAEALRAYAGLQDINAVFLVGTGNATMRLRTGDRVRVDGGQGTVEIVDEPAEPSHQGI